MCGWEKPGENKIENMTWTLKGKLKMSQMTLKQISNKEPSMDLL